MDKQSRGRHRDKNRSRPAVLGCTFRQLLLRRPNPSGLGGLKDVLIQPMINLGFSPRVSASFSCTAILRDSPGINAM